MSNVSPYFGSSFNPATATVTTFKWHDLNNNLLYDTGEVDLDPNGLDFVALAQGMGVGAVRPADSEALTAALERALREPGPHLIEAVFPSGF